MESVREVLRGVGTWDLVRLNCGELLKGDYRSCQYIALNRQDTDTLEFTTGAALSAGSIWALLGLSPQVSPRHKAGRWAEGGWPAGGSRTVWLSRFSLSLMIVINLKQQEAGV